MTNNEALEIAWSMGYRALRDGRVRGPSGKILKLMPDYSLSSPYLKFSIMLGQRPNRKLKRIKVHRLVAYQKYGNAIFAPGILVRHKDNNYMNNSYENILIGTPKDNYEDIPKHQRVRLKHRKFSADDVKEIRRLYHLGWKTWELGRDLHVSEGTISKIIKRKSYADVV